MKVFVVVTHSCGGADGTVEENCADCDVPGVYLSRKSAEVRAKRFGWWGEDCENPLICECEVEP
jgi:hypothetical protein